MASTRYLVILAVLVGVCLGQSCSDLKISCNGVSSKDGTTSDFCTMVRTDKKMDAFDDGVCTCAPGGDYSVAWFDDSTQWKNYGSGVDTTFGDCKKSCKDLYNDRDCTDGKFGYFLLPGETSSDKKFYALKTGLKNSIDPTFNSFSSMSDGSTCPGTKLLTSGALDFMGADKCGSKDGFNGLQKDERGGFYQRNPFAYGGCYAFVNSRSDCPQLRNSWDDWQGIVCRKNPGHSPSPPKPAPAPPAGCKKNSDCIAPGPCATTTCRKGSCVVEMVAQGTACNTGTKPTGDCDVADYCDGVNAACVDAVAPSSTVCRASTGDCDVAEYCTGVTKECPKDRFATKDTVCRAKNPLKQCDVAEYCTEVSAACPKDASKPGCSESQPKPPTPVPPTPKPKCKFDYNSDCVKCTARTVNKFGGTQVVTVDLSACKDGDTISWFCCRNRNKWGANICSLKACRPKSSTSEDVTCNDATSADYGLPASETTLTLQVHDGNLEGNVDCKSGSKCDGSSDCCGGGKGSCGLAVAEWTLNLNDCGVKPPPPTPAPPTPVPPTPVPPLPTCNGKCSDNCARCKVRPDNNPTKVVVDFSGCGSAPMDWACCLDKGCDASSCSGGKSNSCSHDSQKNRCENTKELVLTVGKWATSANVQYSDTDLKGSVDCSKGGCCGSSHSTCSTSSSVCTQEVSLETCPSCLEDSDCTGNEDGCERAVCVKGSCKKVLLSEGTVCRYAAGECESTAVCNGKSPVCPDNEKKKKGEVCRASTGPCDDAEVCDGKSCDCPANQPPHWGCGTKKDEEAQEMNVEAKLKRR